VQVTLPVDGLDNTNCEPEELVIPVGGTLAETLNTKLPVAAVVVAAAHIIGKNAFEVVLLNAGRYL